LILRIAQLCQLFRRDGVSLSQAAAVTAGGAALATALPLSGAAAAAGQASDPILEAIEAHTAAYAEWTKWLKRRGQLDEELPAERCKTDLVLEPGVVVETDDPQWIEAEREYVRTADIEYGASWELLNIPLATTSAISAMVDYALVHDVDGEQWPEGWHRGLLEAVSEALADVREEGASS
jgi:hypothetical protein